MINNSNAPIIFCHYGFSKYLPYVFQCVKLLNSDKDIILLGDESNKKTAQKSGIKHFNLSDFDFGEDIETFNERYELIASKHFDGFKHGKDWNEFVFRKWFILYNFVEKNGIQKFWHFDSDVMILCDLSKFEERYSDYDFTEQCLGQCPKGLFNNLETLKRYNQKINELYARKDFIADFKRQANEVSKPFCFSEMSVYDIFKKEEKFSTFAIGKAHDGMCFDDLICRGTGLKMENLPLGEHIKSIHLNDDGRFFGIEEKSQKPILMQVLNLSWTAIYIFDAVLKHAKLQLKKNICDFNPNSPTLRDVKVPLWRRIKRFRSERRKKRQARKAA